MSEKLMIKLELQPTWFYILKIPIVYMQDT